MAERARHAFGNSESVEQALLNKKINEYDILFLDGDTSPKIGWIDANGEFRLVKNDADLSKFEQEIADIESELSKKVAADDVETLVTEKVTEKIAEVNSAYEVIEF